MVIIKGLANKNPIAIDQIVLTLVYTVTEIIQTQSTADGWNTGIMVKWKIFFDVQLIGDWAKSDKWANKSFS